ncbi:MAG: sulfite exporter TauE/SafE family protein [Pseudomonadota bacterium]|nr:sulfite exporter TauE/SafE family protein [Pseudomonadota bacterium]
MRPYLLIGLISGIFGGLVGLGGGVAMVPLLVGMGGMSQRQAHGTSLVALVFTGIIGATIYALHHSLDIWAALFLGGGALWPARLGAKYCVALPAPKLKRSFGFFLLFISALILAKPCLSTLVQPETTLFKSLLLLGVGALTGFCSGLLGVGGGAIMIAGMVLLAGFDQHTAQGSSLLAMAPAGAVGAFTHWRLGNVVRPALSGLIPGIALGACVGGVLAHFFTEGALKFIFVVVLTWTGIRMIWPPRSPRE